MAIPSFDLLDILRTIKQRKNFILSIVLGAMVLGAVVQLIRKTKYKSESGFLVNNPLYTDRSSLFRSMETRFVDFYAGEEDVDKVIALSNSDTVIDRIIRNSQFQEIYRMDINEPKGHAMLMAIFRKNFNLRRSEYKHIEVSYVAYDPQTAANVTNMAVKVLEEAYRSYFTIPKQEIYKAISNKTEQLGAVIDSLTDSLAAMRDRYGIYNILSPSRQNVIEGEVKGNGKNLGMAIEQIQNIEAIKDQLVADRAHYISMLNEFSASTDKSMSYLKVITRATPSISPYGIHPVVASIIGGLLAFFFGVLFVLFSEYRRRLKDVL